ncbi:MAG: MarR family transcriptional regulator [Chloroflexota bacterium]
MKQTGETTEENITLPVREYPSSDSLDSRHQLLLDNVLQKMMVLPRLMRLAFKQMTAERQNAGPGSHLDLAHIGIGGPPVLMVLSSEGPLRSGVVAERRHMPEPMVSKTLKNLERSKLIERTTDPDDRRVVWVSLTPEGTIYSEKLRANISRNLAEILGPLSNQDLDDLGAAFTHLERIVEAAEQKAAQAAGKQTIMQEISHVADITE